jgi:ferritin-like protein
LLEESGTMPEEIFDIDRFIQVSERAEYCAIKRLKKTVKLKIRTPRKLYTLKIDPIKAEETLKKLRCEIKEV